MAESLVLAALLLFTGYSAVISPRRRFSWAMYSRSAKAFLWVMDDDGPRPLRPGDLGLAPDNHFLTVSDLARLLATTRFPRPVDGLLIGYTGDVLVRYQPDRRQLSVTHLDPGVELDELAKALNQLTCR